MPWCATTPAGRPTTTPLGSAPLDKRHSCCGVRILRRPGAPGGDDRPMLLFLAYRLVCGLLHLALVRSPVARPDTVELLALRHEVRVLRRQVTRPAWRPRDRRLLTALSRCRPRAPWGRLPVRPETLLRWHRALVRRRWAAFGHCQVDRGEAETGQPAALPLQIGAVRTSGSLGTAVTLPIWDRYSGGRQEV